MATSRVNIRDVAIAAGVSRATVSQVLRGTGRISDETRRRVEAVMKQIGYVYNRAAASLRAGQSTTIAIAVTGLGNPFFAELASRAAQVLEKAGYVAAIVDTHDDLTGQARFLRMLRENMMAGAIVSPASSTTDAMARDWQAGAPPIVGLLRRSISAAFDFVGVDNVIGMAAATTHLIELGHRTIGFVGGRSGSQSREERLAGWRSALAGIGQQAPEAWIEPCEASITAGSQAVTRLIARCPDLTAVVCHQDIVAFGVTIGLRKLGIEPGRAVSVVGFDDIGAAADWDPGLTTMSVTPGTLGAEAARMLLRRIEEPDAPLQSIVLRPRLVQRASSGPPLQASAR
ncbi:LacI family DNA-binding transcriptional regulator [Labrys wisconsinensis]|uniref:LacI family transcriptional regulator n=1 Tax=Labrys wisconsinensis TaxID=425677 RepID=A0ABU0J6I0_9HYPH|nr:LacI family DNA-binding transcriptional regulator [Labrys wisconsinensis]MDQ0469870.1 LacI family transcriptional regulator [Labrys wisconsinensis]